MRNFVQFLRISSLRKNNNHKLCGFQRRISEASYINKYFVSIIWNAWLVAWCYTCKLSESIADCVCKSSIFRTWILLSSGQQVEHSEVGHVYIYGIGKIWRRSFLSTLKDQKSPCKSEDVHNLLFIILPHLNFNICREQGIYPLYPRENNQMLK